MLKNLPEDIKLLNTEFNGIYRGVVENNNDPLKMGRVQVRIFGLHTDKIIKDAKEGIPTSDLPWVEPILSIFEGSISGYGIWAIPLKGSHVMVFFEGGSYSQPRYFATVPGIPTTTPDVTKGFNDPDGVYPDKLNESDFHRLARGTKDTVTSPAYAAQYPYNIVIATHGGHIIELDNTPGEERINIHHKSESYVEFDKDGNRTEEVMNDLILTVRNDNIIEIVGNKSITIGGNRTEDITGNSTITIGVDKSITISGNRTENITGNNTITIGGNLSITVTGNCLITSPSVTTTGGTTTLSSQATQKKMMTEDMISVFNNHTHPGDSGGTTGTPYQTLSTGSHATGNVTAS